MAPKRAAKKAPPPPPPPAESSDETRSGSRSRSDDSEEDEEPIANSPVPAAATPAPKNAPAPSQKGAESESSEEEEEPVRAAPKNQPPPPQKKEDSDASGSDDDEEDDEEEEEEEPTRAAAAPPSAPKKQPQKKEDSDTSGDEGESEDEEAQPPPKPTPKKEAEAPKPRAPAAAADTKKPGGVQRIWSTDDEVRILEAVAAHQKKHGAFPQPEALVEVLAGKLDNPAYGSKELHSKVRSLRTRYLTLSKKGELPAKEHDRRLLDLCKVVWDSDKTTPSAAAAVPAVAAVAVANAANRHERKGFEEMCELYPYLAEEVKELEAARPGMFKREFGKMDDDKACAMDEKIKRQRVAQVKLDMRRSDLAKEVTKAFIDLLEA